MSSPAPGSPRARRIVPLEAWRGLAAFVVVAHHFCFAFLPARHGGLAAHRTPDSWAGHAAFGLVNGAAAVAFFFVLSGFVLSLKYFSTEDTAGLAEGFLKRIPRLAGPVLATTVLSWLLFRTGGYAYEAAGAETGSTWLSTFGSAYLTPDFQPSLGRAVLQGGLLTFLTGETFYNTNLWTMQIEYYGSLLVFCVAPLWVAVLQRRFFGPAFALTLVSAACISPFMAPFVLGMGLAFWTSRHPLRVSPVAAAALAALALYLFGYAAPVRHYAWLAPLAGALERVPEAAAALPLAVHAVGAVALMVATIGSRLFEPLLDNRFGAWLGQVSFPVYLLHTLLICSVGSHLYLWAGRAGHGAYAIAIAALGVGGATLVGGVALAAFDRVWVRVVNRGVRAFMARRRSTPPGVRTLPVGSS